MTRRFAFALLFAASTLLAGCGGSDDGANNDDGASAGDVVDVLAALENLPVTLEGDLSSPVGEIDVGEEADLSELNFAGLVVDGVGFAVEVDPAVLSAAGIPADYDEVRVRATISRRTEEGSLVVTRLEKL